MLGTFLDKATGILDRQFLIAYWFPTFIVSAIAILMKVYVYGWEEAIIWWQQDLMLKGHEGNFYGQVWCIITALITVTILAYLLKPFTRPMIRFYEGYWPLILQRLFKGSPNLHEKNRYTKIIGQLETAANSDDQQKCNQLQMELFYNFPRDEDRIMPTSLGNALRAAEDYSYNVYGMDSIFWWPRLWLLLPDRVRNEIDESFVPIVAMLNFSSLTVIVTILGSGYLIQEDFGWHALLVLLIGTILAVTSYWAVVAQAKIYGIKIRTSIDLYRFNLLETLHQSLPDTLDDEIKLWNSLTSWVYDVDRGSVANIKYEHNRIYVAELKDQ